MRSGEKLSRSMAGELGFEPRLTESESAVLPLNYSPVVRDGCVNGPISAPLECRFIYDKLRGFPSLSPGLGLSPCRDFKPTLGAASLLGWVGSGLAGGRGIAWRVGAARDGLLTVVPGPGRKCRGPRFQWIRGCRRLR